MKGKEIEQSLILSIHEKYRAELGFVSSNRNGPPVKASGQWIRSIRKQRSGWSLLLESPGGKIT